jgi:hypothetical protein
MLELKRVGHSSTPECIFLMRESKREREKMENCSTGLPVPRELKKAKLAMADYIGQNIEKRGKTFFKKNYIKKSRNFKISVLCTNFLNNSIKRSYFMQILKRPNSNTAAEKRY